MAKSNKGGGLLGDFGRDEVGDDEALKHLEEGWREAFRRRSRETAQKCRKMQTGAQ